MDENGFLEYLQLQDGSSDLVTKSELVAAVRARGYSLSDRQLTFYVTENLMPKSVRVGSRAGAYPAIVVELMTWILQARAQGLPIDTLRELLPVWKVLIRARNAHELDIGELEYVARKHVTSIEGSVAVPRVITNVLIGGACADCRDKMIIVFKDGSRAKMSNRDTTIGFAVAWTPEEASETESGPQWLASTRISLACDCTYSSDPTTVILGLKPNAALPQDPLPLEDEASQPA